MRRFLLLPFAFYGVSLALGLALRFFFVRPFDWVVFGNAVHAHSHTLYFGWVGLGIFVLAFLRLGAVDRTVRWILGAIAAISAATFVAFLDGGYSAPGIVVSTLSLAVWGSAVVVFWRRARGRRGIDLAFLRASTVYVVLSVFGALGRVVIQVLQVPDPLPGKLAVFAFLHDFAWFFVLAIFGLLAWLSPKFGAPLDERLLRLQLWLTVPFAWLTFPLGVAGGATGTLGLVASAASLALLVPAGIGCWNLWRTRRAVFRWLALWFGLQACMEAAGALGLADAAVRSRHLAILYLHVLLLGFVSAGLAHSLLASLGARAPRVSILHNLALVVMAAGLFLAGGQVFGLGGFASAGLWMAAVGGAGVFAAALGFAAIALARAPLGSAGGTPVSPARGM